MPRVAQERPAKESPTRGFDPIQGALANLGHCISDTAVARILKARGIEPAPNRNRETTWKMFLKAHWDVLASVDFTTIQVWINSGLVTCCSLTWNWPLGGCTTNPDESWGRQAARNLGDAEVGSLRGKKYLLMDRDAKFSEAFRAIL